MSKIKILFVLLCACSVQYLFSQKSMTLVVDEMYVENDTTIRVPIKAILDESEIAAYQFTIQWDSTLLELDTISEYALPGMGNGNFGRKRIKQGILTASWSYGGSGNFIMEENKLFTLFFHVDNACEAKFKFELLNKPLDPIAFTYQSGMIDYLELKSDFSELESMLQQVDVQIIADTIACPNDTIVLKSSYAQDDLELIWTSKHNTIIKDHKGDSILLVLKADDTVFVAATGACYEDSNASIHLSVYELNTGVSTNSLVFTKDPLKIEAFGGVSYKWWSEKSSVLSNSDTAECTVIPKEEDRIWVEIIDENACRSIFYVDIAYEQPEFVLYNSITPNGDGQNEVLFFDYIDSYTKIELSVFDRWGKVVYQSDDYQNDWAGTDSNKDQLSAGNYYYILTLDGKTFKSPLIILYE